MEINFITHNMGKLKEARLILEPGIAVNHINLEYDEVQHDDIRVVAKKSAETLSLMLNKAVVVDDSGLFIAALNGFPGAFSSTIHKQIGLPGILKLMDGVKDRTCAYRCAVAHCRPGKRAEVFLGEEKGTISTGIRGSYGFGHDPIFIPEGEARTYGEIEGCESLKKFRRQAFEQLKGYLLNN
ncbi:TPA: non-canonical purine NTP pyrophosphatase [Candidatus Woesearchaeota archaeon]|nr:MAG: dITP/XTP pyrophosphatase [archaeon GW2011_AR11]HIH05457.1 non-canonical purine NTP pyrophosphatase [Candidatus Woesearchaeota archaeon]HIH91790.1 non-canonical purine NTP pyrophosphatase [Candidatus Woesearchaeota archaeon]HIJ19305.1 non-canonical purine NTP pyrophosphatase [Candidatus Woesearchaeota archaeon]